MEGAYSANASAESCETLLLLLFCDMARWRSSSITFLNQLRRFGLVLTVSDVPSHLCDNRNCLTSMGRAVVGYYEKCNELAAVKTLLAK